MRHKQTPSAQRQQRGMVLVFALIILLVLTILGISGVSTSSMQERMAANEHDRQIAFQTAEAALRQGENYIQSNTMDPSMFTSTCTNGLCDCSNKSNGCPVYWTDPNVWATGSGEHVSVTTTFSQVAVQPMYIIEYLGRVNSAGEVLGSTPTASDPMMFRVTARGTGQSPNAHVMLQSTYKKD